MYYVFATEKIQKQNREVQNMTREYIILKGEEQLGYVLEQVEKANANEIKKSWANRGIAQLDMLHFILDEEYENYDSWFWKFEKYI